MLATTKYIRVISFTSYGNTWYALHCHTYFTIQNRWLEIMCKYVYLIYIHTHDSERCVGEVGVNRNTIIPLPVITIKFMVC